MGLLPSPATLKNLHPAFSRQQTFIEQSRHTVRRILEGSDPRLLLIVGPCSIHDPVAAIEYAARLSELQRTVSSQFFILMRVYFEKPRTVVGWKGMVYDPLLDGSHEIEVGLTTCRKLLLSLAEMGIPAATEFLDPFVKPFLEDLFSWGSIGARTSTSQTHRQLASSLTMPVGMKNPIAGSLDIAIQNVIAATQPHAVLEFSDDGKAVLIHTEGNADAHLVLRGWERCPNYDRGSVREALSKLQQAGIPPRVLIDTAHDNSNKNPERQPFVFHAAIDQVIEGNSGIRGLLLESHLLGGSQPLTAGLKNLAYGVSITDPCLGWAETEQLILAAAERIDNSLFHSYAT